MSVKLYGLKTLTTIFKVFKLVLFFILLINLFASILKSARYKTRLLWFYKLREFPEQNLLTLLAKPIS